MNEEQPFVLPTEPGSWLLICDPVWFMGRSIREEYVDRICDWQDSTGGNVVVDGAFQYMRWG